MSQVYNISYSDYEDSWNWTFMGPDLTKAEWEMLWDEVRLKAIKSMGEKFDVVYEDGMLLEDIVELLKNEKGFKEIEAQHIKSFDFAGAHGKAGLTNDIPEKWIPEAYKRFV